MSQSKTKSALSCRERAFLRAFAEKGNLTEAGRTAGFREGRLVQTCTQLLTKPEAQRYLEQYRKSMEHGGREAVRAALIRLAFGQNNDAVSLAMSEKEFSPEEISAMDLFGISELKQVKGGGLEMKFTSRLEALKLLYELERNSDSGSELNSFWNAAAAAAGAFPYEENREENPEYGG